MFGSPNPNLSIEQIAVFLATYSFTPEEFQRLTILLQARVVSEEVNRPRTESKSSTPQENNPNKIPPGPQEHLSRRQK